jgi:UDP-glucose 4-epimerase
VYGPRQSPEGEAGVASILTGIMLRGGQPTLFGHGSPQRDYVFVGDIARANLIALGRGDNTIINLGSGKGTSVKELYDILAQLTGYTGEPKLAPLRAGEVQNSYITGDLAKKLLDWQPEVSLAEGLRQTVEYIRQQEA